jgi:adenine-specific DNA-methyltransferase
MTDYSTYGVKYIGSKKVLLPYIGEFVDSLGDVRSAIDVFAGTTRVAQYLRQKGITTTTSDLSWATSCYAGAFVHNRDNSHLAEHVAAMNALPGVDGWLTANYTGGGSTEQKADGRCFQAKNARRADAARDYIDTLDLEWWERCTLITSVIRGLDAVDNTVGVQQAYLKEWCKRSFNNIAFELPPLITGPSAQHYEGDCLKIDYGTHDLAYLDPPYSPHSYATYYHIWDSIARWDKPATELKARRRVDRVAKSESYDPAMESPWNRPREALGAFEAIIARLPVRYALISYSDESLVERGALISAIAKYGEVEVREIDYKRNIMSSIGNAAKYGEAEKGQKNKELLILLRK